MDTKLSKSHFGKIIQSAGFFGRKLDKLGKKVLLYLAVSFAKNVSPKLVTKETSSVLDKFEKKKKISGKGAKKARHRHEWYY